jgi:pSer/pThr/pTyr-binding forkhead associated (FHA) protein
MNDVMLFTGSVAILLLLLWWVRNGRLRRMAQGAVKLAIGPMSDPGYTLQPGFSYDAPTSIGDDLTIAPVSTYTLSVAQTRLAKGPAVGTRYRLVDGVNALGRKPTPEPQVNLITLENDPAISNNHLYVEMNGQGVLTVTDRGSRNGSRLNGQRLQPDEPTPLRIGDALGLGNTILKVEQEGGDAVAEMIRLGSQYRFQIVAGPAQGQEWVFDQEMARIGRNGECDWRIADGKISRLHAEVKREGDLVRIVDRSSRYGLLVNGRSYQSRVLEAGDIIKLGDSEIRFEPV